MAAVDLGDPQIEIIGQNIDSAEACTCAHRESLLLFTQYQSIDPPLPCGDCFGVVPLHCVPPTYDGEYHDIVSWQADYHACDKHQMGCETLERAATREMAHHDSSLSRRGLGMLQKTWHLFDFRCDRCRLVSNISWDVKRDR